MLLLEGVSNYYKFKVILFDKLEEWSNTAVLRRQSPIPLEDNSAVKKHLPCLKFHNYDKKFMPVMKNSGTSVHIWFGSKTEDVITDVNVLPTISGGALNGEYVLKEIHFHWESEHTINGKRFPLEGHFIHFKKDHTFDEAMKCDEGLCVLSAMYEVSTCENESFETICDCVQEICDEVDTVVKCESEISGKDILPKFTESFYTYHGSLADHGHINHEKVIWIVFKEPGYIGRKQLKNLTNITGNNFEPVRTNRRNLQDVNDREVIYTTTFLSTAREFLNSLFGKRNY